MEASIERLSARDNYVVWRKINIFGAAVFAFKPIAALPSKTLNRSIDV